ncbi:MAG: T9SS type A sorting domain-containing protein [Cryomorphaceae bacterium]|nr:T9SS type A sorting domain-containing protein [Cryomorphaceae bacterium]
MLDGFQAPLTFAMLRQLYRVFLACIVFCLPLFSVGQVFNGIVVREVPITLPADLAAIQTAGGFAGVARCWRVYVCIQDLNYELQAVAGGELTPGNLYPWTLDCPGCTGTSKFYQTPAFTQFIGDAINPALWPFVPGSQFDSWWFIGDPVFPGGLAGVIWTPNPAPNPQVAFELGGAFNETSITGSVLGGFWAPPSVQGKADAENKVLIGQFTTDGIFSGTINLQFRRLNPDNTVFIPVTTELVTGIQITNDPSIFVTDCPQIFAPLDLLSFNAAASDDRVNLMFTTLNEDNVDHYIVERSMDLENWSDVGTLPAKGGDGIEAEYFLVDHKPNNGVNYYRLSEKTYNGEISHIDTRSVLFEARQFEVYPNPARDRIWFKGDLSLVKEIRIISMTGQVVLSQAGGADPIREMDVQKLATGMYLVEFNFPESGISRIKLEVN